MTYSNFKHWKLECDSQNILWVQFDRSSSPVNSFSAEVMDELAIIIQEIEDRNPMGVVVTSAKKTGFIAGADITQFTSLESESEAFDLIRQGQNIFDRWEKLPMPTIALINGFCLGGGYEFALSCRYRIALDEAKVKIGLPEIKLGIQPGWGGTVRLPRLIGAQKAMGVILPGGAVSARKAYKMGMVDAAVPQRQLTRAARYFIQKKPKPHSPSFIEKVSNHFLVRPFLAKLMLAQLKKKKVKESHYPAPFAVIDNWARFAGAKNEMVEEARSISKLMMTSTAKSLLRVFFLQNTMKDLAKGVNFKPQRLHVIGAGTMGGDIAAWCALRGMTVTLQDQSPDRIAPAMKRAFKLFKKKLKKGHLVKQAMDRLIPDVKGGGVKSADVIIEAVFENLEVKQKIFQQVESDARPDAIIATNTSSIPLEEIATALKDPSRLVGLHFFNPVSLMQLVEIVHTTETPEELIADCAAFVKRIARLPLPVLSSPGFLVNRVLMPYLGEAMRLFEEGVPKESIDKAAEAFGMPMGPIALADKVGLDVCLHVAQNLCQHFGGDVSPKLKSMVDAGELGVKSGAGFYKYNNKGKPITSSSNDASCPEDATDRMILIMLNEAVSCLQEGVVTSEELLDAGMIFGTGFAPFRGGPLNYAYTRGIDAIKNRLDDLSKSHGERFIPSDGWNLLLSHQGSQDEKVEESVENVESRAGEQALDHV